MNNEFSDKLKKQGFPDHCSQLLASHCEVLDIIYSIFSYTSLLLIVLIIKHICTYDFLIYYCRMPGLSCRFYQHKFPEVEDVVMVNVRSIAEMGAYVSLLEYNNIEGMILLSELSRRRIRSINKLIRIGRNECVVVIRVDKEKGELHNKYSNFFNP